MASISILAVEGGLYSNITALCDAFFIADLWHRKVTGTGSQFFKTRVITMDGRPVEACGGFTITPDCSINDIARSDYIIISPQMPHLTAMPDGLDRLRQRLETLMAEGAVVATVCTGSFLLAEMGLLDDRRATTNLQFARMFRKRYPRVILESSQMLVKTGNIITTGAVTAVYNLILHMIRDLSSPELATIVSKALLIDDSRQDQTPYALFSPAKKHGDAQVLDAQEFIEKEFSTIKSTEEIAREVGVSPRHFIRRFKKATGEPPLKYLQQIRIEKAKEKLQTTRDTVDEITWAVGYQDISSFGRLFKQHTKLSPKAYRDKFSPPGSS